MANFLYVDNSNVWIEGMHVSAVERGLAPDIWTACGQRICDTTWTIDFGRLYEFAGGDAAGRAALYGSRPPANDSLWEIARRRGFEVIVFDRNAANHEKKIDTTITADMISDSYEHMQPDRDEITLVAGDRDFVPAVEKLRKRRYTVHVVFWDHAGRELKEAAGPSGFVSLNQRLQFLNAKRGR